MDGDAWPCPGGAAAAAADVYGLVSDGSSVRGWQVHRVIYCSLASWPHVILWSFWGRWPGFVPSGSLSPTRALLGVQILPPPPFSGPPRAQACGSVGEGGEKLSAEKLALGPAAARCGARRPGNVGVGVQGEHVAENELDDTRTQ